MEFSYRPSAEGDNFAEALSRLATRGGIAILSDDGEGERIQLLTTPQARRLIGLLRGILLPFLDAYWVAGLSLLPLDSASSDGGESRSNSKSKSELLSKHLVRTQQIAETLYLENKVCIQIHDSLGANDILSPEPVNARSIYTPETYSARSWKPKHQTLHVAQVHCIEAVSSEALLNAFAMFETVGIIVREQREGGTWIRLAFMIWGLGFLVWGLGLGHGSDSMIGADRPHLRSLPRAQREREDTSCSKT